MVVAVTIRFTDDTEPLTTLCEDIGLYENNIRLMKPNLHHSFFDVGTDSLIIAWHRIKSIKTTEDEYSVLKQ